MRRVLFLTALLLSTSLFAAPYKPEKVSFKSKGGVSLKAFFNPPSPGNPTVVLLHGLASSKEEWLPFAEYISKRGWGVLAYDARGHGASSKTKDNNDNPNGFQYFGKPGPGTEWERMVDDVGAALAYLRVDRELDNSPIVLCGASLGANVAINFSALSRSIKSTVLLSPGINFAGFVLEAPLKQVNPAHVLLIASSADRYSYESCSRVGQSFPFWSDVKAGHGVQMLDEALMKRIFEWLGRQK